MGVGVGVGGGGITGTHPLNGDVPMVSSDRAALNIFAICNKALPPFCFTETIVLVLLVPLNAEYMIPTTMPPTVTRIIETIRSSIKLNPHSLLWYWKNTMITSLDGNTVQTHR